MHLQAAQTITFAHLAASPFDIETETSHAVATHFGSRCFREQLADRGESAGVCDRVTARSATDRTLANLNHLIKKLNTLNSLKSTGALFRSIQLFKQLSLQNIADQR